MNADSERITDANATVDSTEFDFEDVFLAQYPRVVRIIGRILNDEGKVEDLAIEVFWKLWRKSQIGRAHV